MASCGSCGMTRSIAMSFAPCVRGYPLEWHWHRRSDRHPCARAAPFHDADARAGAADHCTPGPRGPPGQTIAVATDLPPATIARPLATEGFLTGMCTEPNGVDRQRQTLPTRGAGPLEPPASSRGLRGIGCHADPRMTRRAYADLMDNMLAKTLAKHLPDFDGKPKGKKKLK